MRQPNEVFSTQVVDRSEMRASAEEVTKFLPSPPLFSSEKAGWAKTDFVMRTYHQPRSGAELPELDHAILVINCGPPVVVERTIDGAGHTRQKVAIGPDGITLLPYGVTSRWEWASRTEVLHLHLQANLCQKVARQLELPRPEQIELQPLLGQPDGLVKQLGLSLLSEMGRDSLNGPLYTDTLVNTLVVHLLHHYSYRPNPNHLPVVSDLSPGQSRAATLRPVLDYVEAHLAEPLRLEQLAALSHLSPYHFTRLFKRHTGYAPHQYLILRRVERAKYLLEKTGLELAEIARQVGFADQCHLNRHFRRSYGLTPHSYRCRKLRQF